MVRRRLIASALCAIATRPPSWGRMGSTLILIVGLPASGKSRRVEELSEQLESDGRAPASFPDWSGWKRDTDREELYEILRAGEPCVVESAGFCIPPYLTEFLAEIKRRFDGLDFKIECFDNNPLQCIRLSLQDSQKKYGGNGALARISQILRDCPRYRPDMPGARILPIHPCEVRVSYQPGRDPAYDDLLERINAALHRDGRRLEAGAFKAMPVEMQDVLIEEVRHIVDRSGLRPCHARGISEQ